MITVYSTPFTWTVQNLSNRIEYMNVNVPDSEQITMQNFYK